MQFLPPNLFLDAKKKKKNLSPRRFIVAFLLIIEIISRESGKRFEASDRYLILSEGAINVRVVRR